MPLAAFLAEHDIVVNCVLQDTDAPLMFVTTGDLAAFAPGSLIVDVSCDEGMGFSWARPTIFAEPMFTVGNNVHYYAVDHSPSHLWNSATWEISEALLPHLRPVLAGPDAWERRDHPAGHRDPRRASSRTRASCPSSTVRRTIRTHGFISRTKRRARPPARPARHRWARTQSSGRGTRARSSALTSSRAYRLFRPDRVPMNRCSCLSGLCPCHAGICWKMRRDRISPCARMTRSTAATPRARISSSSRSAPHT